MAVGDTRRGRCAHGSPVRGKEYAMIDTLCLMLACLVGICLNAIAPDLARPLADL